MLLTLFRKYVIANKIGLGLFYALGFFVAESLAFGFNLRTAITFGSIGLIFGLTTASKQHKNGKYFMQNIGDKEKFSQMQKFKKMFAREEIPKDKSEQAEYGNYLFALEESKTRLSANYQWWAMAFLFGMFILYLVSVGINLLALIFPAVLITGGYQMIKSKSDLQKIDRLRQKLPGLHQHHKEVQPVQKNDNWKLP